MDTIKNLTITGGAAQDVIKPRRPTSRKKQPIEGSENDEIMPEIQPKMPARQFVQPLTKPQQPVQQPLQQPVQIQEAGSVILRPPKVQRVKLQP